MSERFSTAQKMALAHPFDGDGAPDAACTWRSAAGDCSTILTCDVDEETAEGFGGPVWHASVCPPVRLQAELLLAGVGQGGLFDEPGARPDIYHLRRRMTADEVELLESEIQ
jgi:hypothetical protein